MTFRHVIALIAATTVLAAASSGCGDDNTPTSPTSLDPVVTTEVFTGQFLPRGSGFYSFQVSASGNGSYTFASLTQPATGRALDAVLTLGVGVPAGEDCNVSSAVDARPGLAPQLSSSVTPGTYCVRLSDPGNLTAATNFAVRIMHP